MNNQKTILFDVIQANSLDQFTLNGKRRLNFHYFQLTDKGWLFRWITEDTDVTWLRESIAKQEIFIFKN